MFYTPGDLVACGVGDEVPPTGSGSVVCSYGSPSGLGYVQLTPDGHVAICTPAHPLGQPGSGCMYFGSVLAHALHYPAGKIVNVGRFRCTVLPTGVQCTVRAIGRGFRITGHSAVRIGPTKHQSA